jgi:RND family efflux transporter MFP subunit
MSINMNSSRHHWKTISLASIALVAVIGAAAVWQLRPASTAKAADSATTNESAPSPATEAKSKVPVVVTPAQTRLFEVRIEVQGTVEAKNTAMVSPRIPGVIESLFVDEGDAVIAGQTKLFATDSLKIQKSVLIQQQDLAVARCAQREAAASLERSRADFEKAELDYRRFARLLEKQAVTPDAFEQQQSRYRQTQAMLKVAEAQVDLMTERQKQAEAALAISEKDLSDSVILAPINGRISMKLLELGEMGSPGQPVFRIDDPSLVEVSAMIPANFYPQIVAGQTQMKITVASVEAGLVTISYKSPTIQTKMRTFEIKALLKDPPPTMVPGSMAAISVVLESRKALGVPTVALQKRGERSVVYGVRDNKARVVEITTGLETDGWTEVKQGALTDTTPVVTMGQYLLNDGTAVTVQTEGR